MEASCALSLLPTPLEVMEHQSEGRGSEGSQGALTARVKGLSCWWMGLLRTRLNQGGQPSKGLPGRALTQSKAGKGPKGAEGYQKPSSLGLLNLETMLSPPGGL